MPAVKPMLAVKAGDLETLPYPLLASWKIDGIRCIITPDGPQTRSGEPIPNLHARKLLSALPAGMDGELVVLDDAGVPDFRRTTGDIRRQAGEPDFVFYVFDNYLCPGPFHARIASAQSWMARPDWVQDLVQTPVNSAEEVRTLFAEVLAMGNEGLVLRDPNGAYKHGRSTVKEAGMLKVKPWEDAEAVVLSVFERMHNTNGATKDNLGHTKRSSTKAGKEGTGMLGGFKCAPIAEWAKFSNQAWDTVDAYEADYARFCKEHAFEVSAGKTTHAEKAKLWATRDQLQDKVIRFQHVTVGGYDVPRHGTFQGFREAWDMDRQEPLRQVVQD